MSRELSFVRSYWKRTELCREDPFIFQDGRLQAISGNVIQRFVYMNNNFNIIVYFIVGGRMTYGVNDRRVIQGSPPWGLRTGAWPVAMECLITIIRRVDGTLLTAYCKRYF